MQSDWSSGEVLAVDACGRSEVVAQADSLPLCTAFLPAGTQVIVSSSGLLLCRQPDGPLITYSELGRPMRNDIVADGRGNCYVNGAGSDPLSGEPFKPGSIWLAPVDGPVRQVADDIAFPNGMAVTADNSTLIVADSYGSNLLAFDIDAAGGLSGRRVWADLGTGVPDGLCLDAEGAVRYADVPNRRCVRVREDGAVTDTIRADRGCFVCVLGGPDRTTLYIVAAEWLGMAEAPPVTPDSGQALAVEVEVPGAGWP